ncbi:dual specificity protein phosphatase 23-like [Rhynchophorus ferrugineus]|uniref:dual specificity protein phosphatase 23-like n=1 Tax=Rhynchophorus ferrugineus TaxID=354439 RepID=UPI003FCEA242
MANCDIPWNFSWVIPNVLAATSCPETVNQLDFLRKEGIHHLVTLSPDHVPPITNYNGLQWSYIPIIEFEAPSLDDIENFITICKKAREKQQAIAVHCRAGRGRTGVMIACYFVYFQDMSPDTAIAQIRALRPWSVETYAQEASVRHYRDHLRSIM